MVDCLGVGQQCQHKGQGYDHLQGSGHAVAADKQAVVLQQMRVVGVMGRPKAATAWVDSVQQDHSTLFEKVVACGSG